MIEFIIKTASKRNKKLRISLGGSSGSGKTYSALKLAYGITENWDKILVIDTERDSANIYADLGAYKTLNLSTPYTPNRYINAIRAAENSGVEVIIIDSVTHEWSGSGGCLEIHAALGGSFNNWATVTPLHNAFIDAIMKSKCHVICTVRKEESYAQETIDGKISIKKLGLKEDTRKYFNYEMDIAFDIEHNTHLASINKNRISALTQNNFLIDETLGTLLNDWAKSGVSNNLDEALDYIREATTKKEMNLIVTEYKELYENEDFREAVKIKRETIKE